jgi:hypothetical protein
MTKTRPDSREPLYRSVVTCDSCGRSFNDPIELQEFLFINRTAGYGSIFGDGTLIQCDLCQNCLKSKLGKFLRTTSAPHY